MALSGSRRMRATNATSRRSMTMATAGMPSVRSVDCSDWLFAVMRSSARRLRSRVSKRSKPARMRPMRAARSAPGGVLRHSRMRASMAASSSFDSADSSDSGSSATARSYTPQSRSRSAAAAGGPPGSAARAAASSSTMSRPRSAWFSRRQIDRSSAAAVAARRPSTCSTISVCRKAAAITTPTTAKMRLRMVTRVPADPAPVGPARGRRTACRCTRRHRGPSRAPLRLPARAR